MNILAGHLLGDILLQNRWLARVKTRAWWGMALHCLITTLAVCAFCGWWDWRGLLAFGAHYAIDGFGLGKNWWPRLINQGDPNSTEPAPVWLRLMDDQALHVVSLALIALIR